MKNNLYIITYDLITPGKNYEVLLRTIKQNRNWARLGGSSYLVLTSETSVQLRDQLKTVLDANDKIYIGLLNQQAAWYGLSDEVSNWILENQK